MSAPRRLFRAIGSAALAAGLLGAGLVAGGVGTAVAGRPAFPTPYYAPGELPRYPNAFEFPIGQGARFNGLPMRLSYFETDDPPERVRDFYVAELGRVAPVELAGLERGYAVSVFDVRTDTQKTVVIEGYGRGSLVFPAIAPGAFNRADLPLPPDLPASSQALRLSDVRTEGPGDQSVVINYHEPHPVADVVAGARRHLEARGWQLANERASVERGAAPTLLRYVRPGRELVLGIRPLATQAGTAVTFQMNDR